MGEKDTVCEWLKTTFADAGYPLTPLQAQHFLSYLIELEKWNQKINLTAFRTREAIVHKLFLASLDFAKGFCPSPGLHVLDLGSGAGIPGVPLKLMFPQIMMTLLERSRKKSIFLQHLCRTLALKDIVCVARDAAALAGEAEYSERYQIVVSRAVGSIQFLLELAFPLLQPGGCLLAEKGTAYRSEMQEAEQTLHRLRGSLREALPLPSAIGEERWLVCLQKEGYGVSSSQRSSC